MIDESEPSPINNGYIQVASLNADKIVVRENTIYPVIVQPDNNTCDRTLAAMRANKSPRRVLRRSEVVNYTDLTGALKYVTIGLIGLTLGFGAGVLTGRRMNE